MASYGGAGQPALNSAVCLGELGAFDGAPRFVRFAEMFGPNGKVFGLCEPDVIPALVADLHQTLSLLASRTCLPRPLEGGEELSVTEIEEAEDGSAAVLQTFSEGTLEKGDYRIVYPTSECCNPDASGVCTGSKTMLVFHSPLPPATRLEVTYHPPALP
jgi:hypothetical protein